MTDRPSRALGALLFLGIAGISTGIQEGNLGFILLGIGLLTWGISIIVSIVKRY